jgi:hypothetical protein
MVAVVEMVGLMQEYTSNSFVNGCKHNRKFCLVFCS